MMNVKDFETLLFNLRACSPARNWAQGRSLMQAWLTCRNADWMLWLLARSSMPRPQLVGLCATMVSTAYHLVDDERVTSGLEACWAYERGEIGWLELREFASLALDAFYDIDDDVGSKVADALFTAIRVAEYNAGSGDLIRILKPFVSSPELANFLRDHIQADQVDAWFSDERPYTYGELPRHKWCLTPLPKA